jgi:hypothetical protein
MLEGHGVPGAMRKRPSTATSGRIVTFTPVTSAPAISVVVRPIGIDGRSGEWGSRNSVRTYLLGSSVFVAYVPFDATVTG